MNALGSLQMNNNVSFDKDVQFKSTLNINYLILIAHNIAKAKHIINYVPCC